MKYLIFTLTIIIGISTKGQQKTYVPDDTFEALLESYGMGDGIADNDSVTTASISTVDSLIIFNDFISDLTGIEDFTSLQYLDCHNNFLSTLDFSNNTILKKLLCSDNLIDTIDLSNCMALEYLDLDTNFIENVDLSNCVNLQTLYLNYNFIENIDLRSCTKLEYLYLDDNFIDSLDVIQNIALKTFWCFNNYLESIDLSNNSLLEVIYLDSNFLSCLNLKNDNNTNITRVFAQGNSNLTCIEVDDSSYSNSNWINNSNFYFDSNHFFSENCNYSSDCFNSLNGVIVNKSSSLTVFPNPTNNIVNIKLDNYAGEINLQLYDFTGKLLKVINNRSLSIEDCPKGIYLLKVSYDDIIKRINVVKY